MAESTPAAAPTGSGRRPRTPSALRRPRTVARSQVVVALVAIVLVTLAAIGYQLSDAQLRNYQVVHGRLGEFSSYGSGTAQVSDVRVGSRLRASSDTVTTTGMFVIVRVTLQASGRDDLSASDLRLRADGATYEPSTSLDRVDADSGFEAARDIVFEVDPARITNLNAEFWSVKGFVQGHPQHLRVPLGITASNDAEWRSAAQGRGLAYDDRLVKQGLP